MFRLSYKQYGKVPRPLLIINKIISICISVVLKVWATLNCRRSNFIALQRAIQVRDFSKVVCKLGKTSYPWALMSEKSTCIQIVRKCRADLNPCLTLIIRVTYGTIGPLDYRAGTTSRNINLGFRALMAVLLSVFTAMSVKKYYRLAWVKTCFAWSKSNNILLLSSVPQNVCVWWLLSEYKLLKWVLFGYNMFDNIWNAY